MKRIIIDTNFYTAFKRNDADAVVLLQQAEYIGISSVILGELFAGFRCGSKERQNRTELDQFLNSARVNVITLDEETAEFYAQVFSELRQKGRPIPSNDLWLAASALQHGLALATYDEHFRSISGLLLAVR
ncbi:type II toxin-antitoxin system VapC family toxin [Geobacter sp.]|uniref:type II toxin-antitoxin system VapC family toxin n=1 Tax=Geobacter sp. TaxID=46610 RepID=UPI00262EB891|nr:type II toxin-antitoxin system VapC family toxin [Geobacter sp.]